MANSSLHQRLRFDRTDKETSVSLRRQNRIVEFSVVKHLFNAENCLNVHRTDVNWKKRTSMQIEARLRAAPIFSYSPPRVERKNGDAQKLGCGGEASGQSFFCPIFWPACLAPTPPPVFAHPYFFAPF